VETALEPAALHDGLHAIEAALGRRRGQRWEARVLDLDLLLFDERVIQSNQLEVPHPGLAYRRFVLEPAAEIAADLRHPTIGWSIGQLLANLNSAPNYLALHGLRGPERTQFAARVAEATGARLLTIGWPGGESAQRNADPAGPDPAIQSWGQGIEFLAAMREQLAEVSRSGTTAFVSDFCWREFPLRLGLLAPTERQRLIAEWQTATPDVTMPKLLVLLKGLLIAAGESSIPQWPYLQVAPADPTRDALAEVVAAVEAMR